jgi:hypothetical protein
VLGLVRTRVVDRANGLGIVRSLGSFCGGFMVNGLGWGLRGASESDGEEDLDSE